MRWLKVIDGELTYPYLLAQIATDYPNVSFPRELTATVLADYAIYPVTLTAQPAYDVATQAVDEDAPQLADGVWTQQWTVRDKTAEELAAVRNRLHEQRHNARTDAEMAGFIFQDKRIDSDRDSILRITQAALLASQALAAEQPFGVVWICADDSVLELDAGGMLGMQQALTLHGLACHNRSQALRDLIDAASDGPSLSLAAAELTEGWPV